MPEALHYSVTSPVEPLVTKLRKRTTNLVSFFIGNAFAMAANPDRDCKLPSPKGRGIEGEGAVYCHSEGFSPKNLQEILRSAQDDVKDYSESHSRETTAMRLRLGGRNDGKIHSSPLAGEDVAERQVRGQIGGMSEFTNPSPLLPLPQGEREKRAFTLAEVLITLGIIGVVAAMTLPTLIQKQQRKAASVQLKKFYSIMSQAILLAENEYGEMEYWSRTGNLRDDDENEEAQKNIEQAKDYWSKYFAPHIKTLKYENSTTNEGRNIKIYLADGSTIDAWNGGCFSFSYDVNGDKKPNLAGQDIFRFHICELKYERSQYLGNNIKFGPAEMINTPNRETALEKCKTLASHCAPLLILYDDFEFKKDYPW